MKYLVEQGAGINIKDKTGVSHTTASVNTVGLASFTLLEVVACPPEIFLSDLQLFVTQLAMVGV